MIASVFPEKVERPIGALSIDGSHANGVVREAMIYANVIGCDLGPKINAWESGNPAVASCTGTQK